MADDIHQHLTAWQRLHGAGRKDCERCDRQSPELGQLRRLLSFGDERHNNFYEMNNGVVLGCEVCGQLFLSYSEHFSDVFVPFESWSHLDRYEARPLAELIAGVVQKGEPYQLLPLGQD
jgi:hypothetical protein